MRALQTSLTAWDVSYNQQRREDLLGQAGPVPTIPTTVQYGVGVEESLNVMLLNPGSGNEGLLAFAQGNIPPVFQLLCPTGHFALRRGSNGWVIQL